MKYFSSKKQTVVPPINHPTQNFTREAIQIILDFRKQSTQKNILEEQIDEFFNEEYLSIKNTKLTCVILEIYLQYNNNDDNLLIEKWVFNQESINLSSTKFNATESLRSIYLIARMPPSFSLLKDKLNYKLFSNTKKETAFSHKTLEIRIRSNDTDIEVIYEYLDSSIIKKIKSGDYLKARPRFYSDSQKGKFQFLIYKYDDKITITDDYYSYNEKSDNALKKDSIISKGYYSKGTSFAFENIKTEDTLENSNAVVNSKSPSSSSSSSQSIDDKNNEDDDDNDEAYELHFIGNNV